MVPAVFFPYKCFSINNLFLKKFRNVVRFSTMTWHSRRHVLLAAEDRCQLMTFGNPPELVRERFSRLPVFLGMCLRLKVTVPRVIIEAKTTVIYEGDASATMTFLNTEKKKEAAKKETPTQSQGFIANTNDIAKRSSFLREVNTEFSR